MEKVAVPPGFYITPEQFEQLADREQEARLELTASGELVIIPPTGGSAGSKNFRLIQQLANWIDSDKTGVGFDSSTVFILPSGARRSPDASWIELDRWNQLTSEQQDGFPPIAPDFAIELVSPSERCDPADETSAKERAPREKNQRYRDLQNKMQEYLDNGVKLGWLIEPKAKKVEIYRRDKSPEVLNNPQSISGEDILPGFILDLSTIFC